jgi:hypothetical protein
MADLLFLGPVLKFHHEIFDLERIAHGARSFCAPVQKIVLLILNIIKQILVWVLSQKDLHFVLHAKGHNYPAYGANFQGYGLNTWINEEPLPGL